MVVVQRQCLCSAEGYESEICNQVLVMEGKKQPETGSG